MVVLSLFDGISCGRIALERAGVQVDKYFASEVDKFAINVTAEHYPDTVQLGTVTRWGTWELPEVDLLLGGSPCQGFSTAGKYLNWDDPRSLLFFKYVEVLNEKRPRYFLFENVLLDKEVENAISNELGVEPVELDSALVSAQSRRRLYWTNIDVDTNIKDRGVLLSDVLDKSSRPYHEIPHRFWYQLAYAMDPWFTAGYSKVTGFGQPIEKAYAVLASDYKGGSNLNRNQTQTAVVDTVRMTYRALNFLERERLQTIPERYTENLSNHQRYKTTGDAWTVDIIAHILSRLV